MAVASGNEWWVPLALSGALIALFLVLYGCATFTYEFVNGGLRLRWNILARLPFARRTIPFAEIADVRGRQRGDMFGAYVFGKTYQHNTVVLVLRRRFVRFAFAKRVLITPADPAAFVAELRRRMHQRPAGS
jgi:hypothetical protein